MSTLLGFTWIFGFMAAFADVAALWYVFIIFNSLQGVYIFIAFMCNKRVFKLWSNACSGASCVSIPLKWPRSKSSSSDDKSSKKRDQHSSTTSTTTTTTTSKSESTVESVSEAISMTESSNVVQELKQKIEEPTRNASSSTTTVPTSEKGGKSEATSVAASSNFLQELKNKINESAT